MNRNMFPKVFAVFFLVVFLSTFFYPVFSHSGRTDYKGGHYVGGTSEYHYHHGLSAHDHPDGVCPYKKSSTEPSSSKAKESNWTIIVVILLFIFLVIPLINSLFFDTKNTLILIISIPFMILSLYLELIWELIKAPFIFFKKKLFKKQGVDNMNNPSKKRFCKYCGNEINPETKQCTGCQKQYFRGFKARNILFCFTTVVLFSSNIILLNNLHNAYADRDYWLNVYTDSKRVLSEKLKTASDALSFYNNQVALISDDNTKTYHKYGCKNFDDSSFWTYSTDLAKEKGYTECPACHKTSTTLDLLRRMAKESKK